MPRRPLTLLLLCSSAAVAAVVACGEGHGKLPGPEECAEDQKVCADDGKLYCKLPGDRKQLETACCERPAPKPLAKKDAGEGDAGEPADAAAEPPDAAAVLADGGRVIRGAGPDAASFVYPYSDGGKLECDLGDAGRPTAQDGGPRDDAGLTLLYACGVDLCHPTPEDGGGFGPSF